MIFRLHFFLTDIKISKLRGNALFNIFINRAKMVRAIANWNDSTKT